MADGIVRKKGKKNIKHGRNKKWCELYERLGTRRKNKIAKMVKHLRKNPGDAEGAERLAEIRKGE